MLLSAPGPFAYSLPHALALGVPLQQVYPVLAFLTAARLDASASAGFKEVSCTFLNRHGRRTSLRGLGPPLPACAVGAASVSTHS